MSELPTPFGASPYPGIRPVDHPGQLKGRRSLVEAMVNYLERNYPRLIEIYGPSGVGKSSLLKAGLVPKLCDLGWRVVTVSDWAQAALQSSTPEDAYEAVLGSAMKAMRDSPDAPKWLAGLDKSNPTAVLREVSHRTVVILDQIEELRRVEPTVARGLLQSTCDVVSGIGGYWHIVSFRQEVRHEIAELVERRLSTANWTAAAVDPVEDVEVHSFVVDPLEVDGLSRIASATPEFLEVIERAWKSLADDEPAGSNSEEYITPGLLHLQALLAVCWDLAVERQSNDEVTLDVSLLPENGIGKPRALFNWGLAEYMDSRVTRASKAVSDIPRRQRAIRDMASRIAPQLWSAGFKIYRDALPLARNSMLRLGELRLPDHEIDQVLLKAPQLPAPLSGKVIADNLPTDLRKLGDSDAVAGPAAAENLSPIEVVCESVATFEQALGILNDEAIVRVTQGPSRRIVGLCHDALGDQLTAREESMRSWSVNTIDSLVMVSGERVLGDVLEAYRATSEEEWRPTIGSPDFQTLDYLVWMGCSITANFQEMSFRNCIFSGSIFNRCRFENVRFENCRLWGGTFMNCEFVGSSDTVIEGDEIRALSFLWRADCPPGPRFGFESGAALRFRNVGGSGVFVIDASGGPLIFDSTKLDHVKVNGYESGALGPVEVVNSKVRHFQAGEFVDRPIRVAQGSTVDFADSPTGNVADFFEADGDSTCSAGLS
jgi:Pentapeptide repeats (8 copies)